MSIATVLIIIASLFVSFLAKSIIFEAKQKQGSQTSFYLNSKIGNIELDVKLSLDGQTWVKSNECKICDTSQKEKCQQSCFSTAQQFGINCVKPYCKQYSQNYQPSVNSKILEGKKVNLKLPVKSPDKDELSLPTILVSKMNEKVDNIGIINPIFLMLKAFKQLSIFSKNDQQMQLLHGQQLNIETIGQPIKFQFSEEDADLNTFQVGQVKLSKEDPLLTVDQMKEEPFTIKNYTAKFSLEINNLSLPKKLLNEVVNFIISKWIDTDQSKKCQFKEATIICKQKLELQLLKATKMHIVLDGLQVVFPLQILITNIKSNSCTLRLSQSQSKYQITIGSFIFNIFAFSYNLQNRVLSISRMKNNWSKYFDQSRKRTQGQQYGYFWGFFHFLFLIFQYLIKGILILAGISILLNCFYKRQSLINWFSKIINKVKQRRRLNQSRVNNDQKTLVDEEQSMFE